MGSQAVTRKNAVYIAWAACNPTLPWPKQLGEVIESAPETEAYNARMREYLRNRKHAQKAAAQAA